MKQITKDTILIQGDERYNAVEIEQGIIWIDMNLRPQHGDLCITLIKQEIKPKIAGVIMPGDKIIAATFDLEGIPKIELSCSCNLINYPNQIELCKELCSNKIDLEDDSFLNQQLIEHRKLIKESKTIEEQNRRLVECDMISYLKQLYKANKAKWTDDDMIKAIAMAKIAKTDDGLIDMDAWISDGYTGAEAAYTAMEIIQSLNSIKSITVDENFKILSYE